MKTLVLVSALLVGCGGHPRPVVTPAQKQEALVLYLNGASSDQIAARFSMERSDVRQVLRMTIRELSTKYYRQH